MEYGLHLSGVITIIFVTIFFYEDMLNFIWTQLKKTITSYINANTIESAIKFFLHFISIGIFFTFTLNSNNKNKKHIYEQTKKL